MGVVDAIDAVADIVHVAGNPGQLDGMFVVAQFFQDASGRDGDFGRVFLRVVGITEGVEHFVALFQIDAQFLGMGDIFIGQFFMQSFLCSFLSYLLAYQSTVYIA